MKSVRSCGEQHELDVSDDAVDARQGVPDLDAVQPTALTEIRFSGGDSAVVAARQRVGCGSEGGISLKLNIV